MKVFFFFSLLSFFLQTTIVFAANFRTDPDEAILISKDIDHFWEAYDKASQIKDFEGKVAVFQKLYIDRGSKGLQAFSNQRRLNGSDGLVNAIEKRPKYYQALRFSTNTLSSQKEKIIDQFKVFKSYYPEAVFPPVYFAVGEFISGGFVTDEGLMIGIEIMGKNKASASEEFSERFWKVLKPIEDVPAMVSHELIHFNQSYIDLEDRSLLEQTLIEGVAEFLGILISGKTINQVAFEYGFNHEAALKEKFLSEQGIDGFGIWVYGGANGTEYPNDLGYFIGSQIAKAYYEKAENKQEAIKNLLNIEDFEGIVKESGYFSNLVK